SSIAMKSRGDPIRSRLLLLAVVATLLVAGVPLLAVWAFDSAEPLDAAPDWQPPTVEITDPTDQAIDYAVFDVELWSETEVQAPAPVRTAVPLKPSKLPIPRLTLVGILTEPSDDGLPIRRAVLYDQEQDELLFASVGDTVASVLVHEIGEAQVRLAVSDQMYLMPLDGDPGWGD
ncbi:MAG: hypothetical protein AAFS11_10015, partial [Planctomycetota bacterium]